MHSRQPLNGDDDDDDDNDNNNNTIINHYGTFITTAVCPVQHLPCYGTEL
jgi:hypothetical protein